MGGTLFLGQVMHRRLFPVGYRFRYRVFSLLLDIDRLSVIARELRLLSHNRFNLFSFHDRDHGPRDGTPLRPWVEKILAGRDIDLEGGSIEILCFPRVLGHTFNPLSVWYCRHRDGRLRAVLCEVSNTFGESHGYLLHERGAPMRWPVRQQRRKRFHVSPFIPMQAEYRFRLSEPASRLRVTIHQYHNDRLMLAAVQSGEAHALTDRTLMRAFLSLPFMTLKVIAMIHWQAMKIWLKGAQFHRKPVPPAGEVS